MQPTVEQSIVTKLSQEIEEIIKRDVKVSERERASRRIRLTIEGIARQMELSGEVKMFGSFSNGFKTSSSDLDVVYSGTLGPDQNVISLLGKFATKVPEYGFENVTKIFQATVPLVKFTDKKSNMEVDFCVNNDLGVRNSLLLHAYCRYDTRVLLLGRLVKDWAKRHDLVGTADGCLNSYAYMLLVIYFVQSLQPPVVPNLQLLAKEPVRVQDNKWGCEDYWETKFEDDVDSLPPSENKMHTCELLIRFFHFYGCVFNWHDHAVCMRLNRPGTAVDKYSLATPTTDEQWYAEDPFDLKHNLAGKCTRSGRKRILDEMVNSFTILTSGGSWSQACPPGASVPCFLKCRVSHSVTPALLLEAFEEFDLVKLHFPKTESGGRMGQAFLEFNSSLARRRAHTKNEMYVADCQLQLHYSTQHSLAEAVSQNAFSTYEMASYKMQRQIVQTRVQGFCPPLMPQLSDMVRPPGMRKGGGMIPPPPPPLPDDAFPGPPQFFGIPAGGGRLPPHPQMLPLRSTSSVLRPRPSPPPGFGPVPGMDMSFDAHAAAMLQPEFIMQHRQGQMEFSGLRAYSRHSRPFTPFSGSLPPKPSNRGQQPTLPAAGTSSSSRAPAKRPDAIESADVRRSKSVRSRMTSSRSEGSGGWIQIALARKQQNMPESTLSVLTQQQQMQLRAALPLLRGFKLQESFRPERAITIHVEVESPKPLRPGSLSNDLCRKLQQIQGWLERERPRSS